MHIGSTQHRMPSPPEPQAHHSHGGTQAGKLNLSGQARQAFTVNEFQLKLQPVNEITVRHTAQWRHAFRVPASTRTAVSSPSTSESPCQSQSAAVIKPDYTSSQLARRTTSMEVAILAAIPRIQVARGTNQHRSKTPTQRMQLPDQRNPRPSMMNILPDLKGEMLCPWTFISNP